MNEQASNVTTLAYQKQSAPAVSTGLFLTPSNLAEAMQIAKILADSDFVPKDYQRKPGNILVGSDGVADALRVAAQAAGLPLQIVRNGSRGLFRIEPLVEVGQEVRAGQPAQS